MPSLGALLTMDIVLPSLFELPIVYRLTLTLSTSIGCRLLPTGWAMGLLSSMPTAVVDQV